MSPFVQYIPNALSVSRIILSFCLIPAILGRHIVWAAVIFAAAAVSDFLDGHLARRFGVCSRWGALLDPLADKTLMTISYLLFFAVGFIPLYVAAVVITRDVLILAAVGACRLGGAAIKIEPSLSSKINTAVQMIFLVLVLACKLLAMHVPYLLDLGAAVTSASTVYSGVEYVQKYRWIWSLLFRR
ncbi:MAG: CDP-alcohol phosphatidyltransferase family protein [Holosporaceae bacterium]|jgi:cardiolipin synthase|nr:CDP-alcohol phosphatidyltransferase family protein [Holosporaceae bacterium]